MSISNCPQASYLCWAVHHASFPIQGLEESISMRAKAFVAVATIFTLGSCRSPDEVVRPTELSLQRGRSESLADPTFFTNAPGAPAFAAQSVTFWAVKGSDREVSLFYQKRPDRSDSTEFVRFRVRRRSLLSRPDGSPIANGDSVQITLSISDPSQLIVDFQPAGLTFNPSRPAELEFKMDECDLDLNHDGVVDHVDQVLLQSSQVFRQEAIGLPWVPTSTVQSSVDFKAKVDGFTRYAVAY